MPNVPYQALRELWPNCADALRVAISSPSTGTTLEAMGITSNVQTCHFMAQISHECGAGTELIENLNYRAEALHAQWPSHFTVEQANAMAHHPQMIANQAYNGRMGNRIGTDDGWNYRGRGGTQVTGREGYEKLANETGLPLLENPDLVISPEHFIECSGKDFIVCGCLPYATPSADHPKGDVVMVTRRLNGGTIGLSERQAWFAKWWTKVYGAT